MRHNRVSFWTQSLGLPKSASSNSGHPTTLHNTGHERASEIRRNLWRRLRWRLVLRPSSYRRFQLDGSVEDKINVLFRCAEIHEARTQADFAFDIRGSQKRITAVHQRLQDSAVFACRTVRQPKTHTIENHRCQQFEARMPFNPVAHMGGQIGHAVYHRGKAVGTEMLQ